MRFSGATRLTTLLVLVTLAASPLGVWLGQAWLLPLVDAAPAYLVMVLLLRRGERRSAVCAMLAWALALAAAATTTFAVWPADPGLFVLNGPAYRDEMFAWIRTGVGTEGSPRLFLPQHLWHLGAFVLLSLATASALSILMGAVLMNYMAYYVASLARAGVPGGTVVLLGWQPWAICRVAAFSILGAVLAEPLVSRLLPYPYAGIGSARRYLLGAALLILADSILKAALAPQWGLWLRAALGG